ncbi:hypothetical protein [Thalassobellus citreus]|uniref:hypothetical protein n=1 Tax=Thalassobellus citreus TaxID=3367752 RepID=UPI0037A3628F
MKIIRKNYSLIISLVFWILMVGGFSDNWLTNIEQETNYVPKFIIHGILAFTWYTLLVIQPLLISSKKPAFHMKLGLFGIIVFYSMVLSVIFLHLFPYESDPAQLIMINSAKAQMILGVFLVSQGFLKRIKDIEKHRIFILFGTFCLMQPSIDRFTGNFLVDLNLFGLADMIPWLLIYTVLFLSFIWYSKKITWYMIVWFIIWFFYLYTLIKFYN